MQIRPTSPQIAFRFLFALVILTPVTAAWANDVVTAVEMQELLPGNTMSGKNRKTLNIHVYHDPNGTIKGSIRNGKFFDTGTWEVTEDNEYCRIWSEWRNHTRHCFYIYRLETNKYLL